MNKRNGAAPNTVPVVANGKVFIASYKELWVFGIGGATACGAQAATTSPAPETAEAFRKSRLRIQSSGDQHRMNSGLPSTMPARTAGGYLRPA